MKIVVLEADSVGKDVSWRARNIWDDKRRTDCRADSGCGYCNSEQMQNVRADNEGGRAVKAYLRGGDRI